MSCVQGFQKQLDHPFSRAHLHLHLTKNTEIFVDKQKDCYINTLKYLWDICVSSEHDIVIWLHLPSVLLINSVYYFDAKKKRMIRTKPADGVTFLIFYIIRNKIFWESYKLSSAYILSANFPTGSLNNAHFPCSVFPKMPQPPWTKCYTNYVVLNYWFLTRRLIFCRFSQYDKCLRI